MRYWWANQKGHYESEISGGYLWCQKRRVDGSRNPFYEAVRLTRPDDAIFAYARARILAVGLVLAKPQTSIKPGSEPNSAAGWMINVAWLELKRPLYPAKHMAILAPQLPSVSAPLTAQGRGLQGGRLLELPTALARSLLQLAGGTEPDKLVNPDWSLQQLSLPLDSHLPKGAST